MGTFDIPSGRTWIVKWKGKDQNEAWKYNRNVDGSVRYYTAEAANIELIEATREYDNLLHEIQQMHRSSPVKGDMKEGLTNGKPQLSQIPHAAQVYASRSFEYGSQKYERGNYLRPTVDRLADFDRLASYLDAALRHITKTTTEMNRARGCTDKSDADLMAGAMCIDVESGLPHLCGAMCSIMMAVQQAVDAGLIPADPGQPWLNKISK